VGPDGIRVNAVLPWFTRTEMVQTVLEDRAFEQKLIAATPLRRLAEPSDVARDLLDGRITCTASSTEVMPGSKPYNRSMTSRLT
jgi:NAD(P)-dependent dehydrogenase (short-subunit alcohol dehydrogenase family)